MASFIFYIFICLIALIIGIFGFGLLYLMYAWLSNKLIRSRIPLDRGPEKSDKDKTLAYAGKNEITEKEVDENDRREQHRTRQFEKLRAIAEGDTGARIGESPDEKSRILQERGELPNRYPKLPKSDEEFYSSAFGDGSKSIKKTKFTSPDEF